MFKFGKSLIVASLFVVSAQANDVTTVLNEASKVATEAALEAAANVANAAEVAAKAASESAALEAAANAAAETAGKKVVITTATDSKGFVTTVTEKVVGVKDAVVANTKIVKDAAVTHSNNAYEYVRDLGLTSNASNTRYYLVQGTKVAVVTAATVAAAYYVYNKVYGEEKKAVKLNDQDVIILG